MLDQITPVIITFNEECNIGRVLQQLRWASNVIVVDSGSDDKTVEVCRSFGNVTVCFNNFTSPASQFNFGAELARTAWVLALGADYVVTEKLVEELSGLELSQDTAACVISFNYCIFGKVLRGSLYPPAAMLYKKSVASFRQDGHTERLEFRGQVHRLAGKINHDDRKPLSRWLGSQLKYAQLESDKLLMGSWRSLRWKNRIRRMVVFAPALVVLYCLFVRRLVFDGPAGFYYTMQRLIAEAILSLVLLDRKLRL